MIDLAIITEEALLDADGQLNMKDADGCHLIRILRNQDAAVKAMAWDDPHINWSSVPIALISSTWNYQQRPASFLSWLQQAEDDGCQIVNDPRLLQWNLNKRYLITLESYGISIPETHILHSISDIFDPHWLEMFGAQGIVLKPCISASAEGTIFIEDFFEFTKQKSVPQFSESGSYLMQPFLTSIKGGGERSLIFIEGTYTHAFNKIPAAGDFRVQREFGGKQHTYEPTTQEINFAKLIIQMITELVMQPVYARVDICRDNQNNLVLMELEMIEPELWLDSSEEATNQLIQYLVRIKP